MKPIYIIGIGGTGMRCLESFIHMCAMGMCDDTKIHILALDTDKDNGNFRRLRELVEAYDKVKGVGKKHHSVKDTFFSAEIKYYQYSPDYSKDNTFERIFNFPDLEQHFSEKTDLAKLLITKNARVFDLKHGYRAQTHLGSLLMYHAFIEDAKKKNTKLNEFIEILANESTSEPKIFIFGSVFGGTGASAIPIIPKALDAAVLNANTSGTDLLSRAYFGADLITAYFNFTLPSSDFKLKQKIVATSDKFALNSQAALMFYEADETVRKTFQKFYLMGTEEVKWNVSKSSTETITGGANQQNDSHYIELLAAISALDFFRMEDAKLKTLKLEKKKKIKSLVFRTIKDDDRLSFRDFSTQETELEFGKKIGMFTVMSILVNHKSFDFFEAAQRGLMVKDNIKGYESIDNREVEALKHYFELFHYSIENGKIKDGWLRQLHRSAGGGDKFLLHADLFSANTEREMSEIRLNNKLYPDDSLLNKNTFKFGLLQGYSHSRYFSKFKETFILEKEPEGITNRCEQLIKRMYDALCKMYNFEINH